MADWCHLLWTYLVDFCVICEGVWNEAKMHDILKCSSIPPICKERYAIVATLRLGKGQIHPWIALQHCYLHLQASPDSMAGVFV